MKRLTNAEKEELHKKLEEAEKAKFKPYENKIAKLEKENAELKADNDARKFAMAMSEKVEKQLREENSKLKEEWQEQVQKATDEGYARTLQTIQLTKAKEIIKKFLLWENDWHEKTESKYKLLKQAEQFLKDSEVEK